MKIFSCIKQLTDYIESIDPKELNPGLIGKWEGGEEIHITGKRLCKTMLGNFWAVRWVTLNTFDKLFKRGLVGYDYNTIKDYPKLIEVK